MGVLQARIVEWAALPSSSASSWPRNQTGVSHIAGRFFTRWGTRASPYIHIYPLFCRSFTHIGHYRVLSRVHYSIQKVLTSYLVCVCVCVYTYMLYIYICIYHTYTDTHTQTHTHTHTHIVVCICQSQPPFPFYSLSFPTW